MTECKKISRCVIYAPTLCSYGGAALLQSIIDSEQDSDVNLEFYLNKNAPLKRLPKDCNFTKPGLLNLILAERKLLKDATRDDVLIFLTNRPPIKAHSAYCATVLLSALSIDSTREAVTTRIRGIKSWIQSSLNKKLSKNTNVFITRSGITSQILEEKTQVTTHTFPFMTDRLTISRSLANPRQKLDQANFFYPADFSPHKNHAILFKAWELIRAKNISAKLVLTISDTQASSLNNNYQELGITATGYLDDEEIVDLYKSSHALIFPSLIESFPLPLIEARKYSTKIIASERDFIREQVDPEEAFDPLSAVSIMHAVERFMGHNLETETKPNALDFIKYATSLKV